MPAAGFRSFDPTSVSNVGYNGSYWLSSPNESNSYDARTLYINSNGVDPQSYSDRSYGFSVRCAKNSTNSETITLHGN